MIEFPKGRRYFHLNEIGGPEDNMLRLVIMEAAAQEAETEIPNLHMTAREIVPIPNVKSIELIWKNYIAYNVRNETFAVSEKDQPPLESMLSERSNTTFLTFVEKSTWATTELPGPYKHWELVCLNHVIDVASIDAPVIKSL